MIKKELTYQNFDDETVTKTFYFNLMKTEIIRLEAAFPGGFSSHLEAAMKSEDNKTLVEFFETLIKLTVGRREGERLVKNDDIIAELVETNAYDTLFMELLENDKTAANFLINVLPKDLSADVSKAFESGDIARQVQAMSDSAITPSAPNTP